MEGQVHISKSLIGQGSCYYNNSYNIIFVNLRCNPCLWLNCLSNVVIRIQPNWWIELFMHHLKWNIFKLACIKHLRKRLATTFLFINYNMNTNSCSAFNWVTVESQFHCNIRLLKNVSIFFFQMLLFRSQHRGKQFVSVIPWHGHGIRLAGIKIRERVLFWGREAVGYSEI
jgi:hypothetical protein